MLRRRLLRVNDDVLLRSPSLQRQRLPDRLGQVDLRNLHHLLLVLPSLTRRYLRDRGRVRALHRRVLRRLAQDRLADDDLLLDANGAAFARADLVRQLPVNYLAVILRGRGARKKLLHGEDPVLGCQYIFLKVV